MKPYYQDDLVTVYHGDCLEVMRSMPDESVHAIVTDPPYGLGFMGKAWDDLPPGLDFAVEAFRVLKPGGHILAFGGTRTWHRLAVAVEDAGFEIRDSIAWLYGSGFPKSLDVSKAIDKAAGAERQVVKEGNRSAARPIVLEQSRGKAYRLEGDASITAPATDAAREWQGWGTSLKPAFEPVVVGRKPLIETVAANVLAHGTGAINVDGCRVASTDSQLAEKYASVRNAPARNNGVYGSDKRARGDCNSEPNAQGRFPANVILDESQAAALDVQSGVSESKSGGSSGSTFGTVLKNSPDARTDPRVGHNDSGGASRFFPTFRYEAKAPTSERPVTFHPSCDCENSWPTHSRARATCATTSPASLSMLRSGSDSTADLSPMDTTSTTSTTTRPTTTQATSSQSPRPITSASTQDANSETTHGGSPAQSVASSSGLAPATGISAAKDGRSTADAARATSRAWSATSVCGECGKPSKREAHATVKPLDLMRWLVRLVTPPGGTILEPFAGSGTTLEAALIEGFHIIGIEREETYLPLIMQRIRKPLQQSLFGDIA